MTEALQGADYIAGTSKMFAAVAAGAGVSNLVSDFNHLWGWNPNNMRGSGALAHWYVYYNQGRLGTNPYDDYELFFRESPSSHVRTMDVPLLLMHGDADGIVGITETIEFYMGLRFNGKNVIFLNYPGEFHTLQENSNRRDITIRMLQFFDHHLMGAEAPEWMAEGVPFLQKEYGAWEQAPEREDDASGRILVVFVDLSALHDPHHPLHLGDVVQRVARYRDHVGELADRRAANPIFPPHDHGGDASR